MKKPIQPSSVRAIEERRARSDSKFLPLPLGKIEPQYLKHQPKLDEAGRQDGWFNVFTQLGVLGQDKRTGARVLPHLIVQPDLEAMYQAGDIEARIVDKEPEEMIREGFKIIIPDDKENLAEVMLAQWERYDLIKKTQLALTWARLYGGAAMILGINDGNPPEEPVDFDKVKGIDYITVLDKFRIFPVAPINYDVTSQNFGMPDWYRVYTMQSTLPMIHHTRIIRFDGVPVPWRLRAHFNYWGDSVYGRLYNAIRNYHSAQDSAALIIQDFTQFVFQLKNLRDLLAMGPKGEAQLAKRLQLISMTSGIVNAIVIQEDEKAERKSTTLTGLPELMRMINNRLVAATDMPHTILLGESPDGSNATGNSTSMQWYDHIKNKQKTVLQPILMKLLKLFFADKSGPSQGKIPDRFSVEFNPLWQMDEKDAANIRWLQAQADDKYIANSTLQPEEVAESRFGTGQYSTETQLDMKLRNQIEEAIAKSSAEVAGPPPDTHPEGSILQQRDPSTYIADPAPALTKVKPDIYGAKKKDKQKKR